MKNPYNRIINELYKLLYPIIKHKNIASVRDFYNCNYKTDGYFIEKSKKELLANVIENVPYYSYIEEKKLSCFPVMSKEIYRKINPELLSHKSFRYLPKYKMNTGGSTGEPFEFYCDANAGLYDFYHQKYQYEKIGFEKSNKIYVLNGWLPDQNLVKNKVFWRKKKNANEFPFGSKEFSTHYLNITNSEFYIKELISSPPNYLRSYPSVMCELTSFFIASGYTCPPFELKGIQLTSEMTSPQQETYLQEYWGDIIFYQYGHSEASAIATKYPGEEFYTFSPYYGITEILNDQNEHVEEGETGRIVVTSLNNVVRPFIRYDTGDLASFRKNENGVTTVFNIEGRVQDVVEDINGNSISITGLVFGQHFYAFKNILAWQIHNENKGVLVVDLVKEKTFTPNDEKEILEKLSFNGAFNVSIRYVDNIAKTKAGKHKLVIK